MGKFLIVISVLFVATSAMAWVRASTIESRRRLKKWNSDLPEDESRAMKAAMLRWQRTALVSLATAGFIFWLRFVLH